MKVLTQKIIKITFLAVLLTSLSVSMINLVNRLLFLVMRMLLLSLLKQYLSSMNTEKVMKKHFNKNLIMSEEEEEQFQSSNTCWICEKLIENELKRLEIIVM